jgi:serpin B
MKDALSMTDLSDEEILDACRQLMWRANTNGMEAANSLWMQKDYAFADSFIRACAESFMADAFAVDFLTDAAGATDAVNAWASDKTHGKIPEMNPEPLPTDTRLVLINALYFLGKWEIPFTSENSYDQVFHGSKEDADAEFMHDTHNMLYGETDTYQMISMPFKGSDDKADSPYSMAFILPAQGQDITGIMDELSEKGFSAAISGLSDEKVQLALPKFEFTFETSMVNTMQNLGMNLAFEDSAQFDGMTGSENDLYISDILHKCYIRVDEEGAEAAAVTEVIMVETAIQVDDNLKTFTADRPFLFAIYDETDNTVLFLGAIANV